MVRTTTPIGEFNRHASDFKLPDSEGRLWSLEDCRGPRGLLVMFICNHCPYVQAILPKIARDTAELKLLGINSVAIMSNDIADYPEDSPEHMQRLAREYDFSFPYLYDGTQGVAQAYGAVCTPDFFGYNADLKLQFRAVLMPQADKTSPRPRGNFSTPCN